MRKIGLRQLSFQIFKREKEHRAIAFSTDGGQRSQQEGKGKGYEEKFAIPLLREVPRVFIVLLLSVRLIVTLSGCGS